MTKRMERPQIIAISNRTRSGWEPLYGTDTPTEESMHEYVEIVLALGVSVKVVDLDEVDPTDFEFLPEKE